MVCKIVFCSEFPDISDNAGKFTRRTRRRRRRRRRRRTQAIAKRYASQAYAKSQVKHSLRSADISIFAPKTGTFVILRNTDIGCILIHNL